MGLTTSNFDKTDSRFIKEVCSNTKTDFIEITEDKLENILIKFVNDLKSSIVWSTPLSIFITILIVLLTAEFKDFLSISKDVWQAIFYLILGVSFFWFVYAVYKAVKNKDKVKIENLIRKIKNN